MMCKTILDCSIPKSDLKVRITQSSLVHNAKHVMKSWHFCTATIKFRASRKSVKRTTTFKMAAKNLPPAFNAVCLA